MDFEHRVTGCGVTVDVPSPAYVLEEGERVRANFVKLGGCMPFSDYDLGSIALVGRAQVILAQVSGTQAMRKHYLTLCGPKEDSRRG